MQVQQQLEAQQAQHAAQVKGMSSKAEQMEGLIRQATELDLHHVAELNAREEDVDELRQVRRLARLHTSYSYVICCSTCGCKGLGLSWAWASQHLIMVASTTKDTGMQNLPRHGQLLSSS